MIVAIADDSQEGTESDAHFATTVVENVNIDQIAKQQGL